MSYLGKLLYYIVLENVKPTIEKLLPTAMRGFRPCKGTEIAVCSMLEGIKDKKE